jgi:HD-GYP domain-containing protein (c-di-GMP phosphodiesterase class II)
MMKQRVLNLLFNEEIQALNLIDPLNDGKFDNAKDILDYCGFPCISEGMFSHEKSPREAMELGLLYLDKGLIRAALESFMAGLLSASPEDKEGLMRSLAWLFYMQKEPQLAYVCLSLAQVHSNGVSKKKLICERAFLLAEIGFLSKASRLFQHAFAMARSDEEKSRSLLGLASVNLAEQNWKMALDLVTSTEFDNKFFNRVQYIKAASYLGLGWLNDARIELEKFKNNNIDTEHSLNKAQAYRLILWGRLHSLAERFEEALLCFAEAIDCILMEPIYIDELLLGHISWNLAQIHKRLGENDAALIHFLRVQRLICSTVQLNDRVNVETEYTIGSLSRFSRFAPLLEVLDLVSLHEKQVPYAKMRSDRIAHYSKVLADKIGIGGEERLALIWGAKLHDIGNYAVPTELFFQTQPLTDDQWKMIKSHTRVDQAIIQTLQEVLPGAIDVISMHHERLDGAGYPEGLQGENIPIGPRICALAQAYDALTSPRPFRPAYAHKEAVKGLEQLAVGYLDPDLVRSFVQLHTDCEKEADSKTALSKIRFPHWTAVGTESFIG